MRAARGAAALALLLCCGCGYALVGRNTFLPERIKIIVVTPFENRTARPQIEQRVTEEVARELSKRGRYKIVTEKSEADALLEGAVVDFRTNPVQFNAQGRATRVETVVTVQATMRDLHEDAILWSQSGLLFREQYDVPANETSYFDQENQALDELAQGAASTLVTSLLEGF